MEAAPYLRILITYQGIDADGHLLEMARLGQSLQGAARIIGAAGHYAITRKYVRKTSAQSVRVLVGPPQQGSQELLATVMSLVPAAAPLLPDLGAKLASHFIRFILAKLGGSKKEAEMALELAETALKEQGEIARAAIETVRQAMVLMADTQRPAARQFVSPIGETCSTIQIGEPAAAKLIVDRAMRASIDAPEPIEIRETQPHKVLISELDLVARTCKVSIDGDEVYRDGNWLTGAAPWGGCQAT